MRAALRGVSVEALNITSPCSVMFKRSCRRLSPYWSTYIPGNKAPIVATLAVTPAVITPAVFALAASVAADLTVAAVATPVNALVAATCADLPTPKVAANSNMKAGIPAP